MKRAPVIAAGLLMLAAASLVRAQPVDPGTSSPPPAGGEEAPPAEVAPPPPTPIAPPPAVVTP
ncbi:MAG: hypothetical protein JWP35_1809, partial [Caulobacter sp.]|nr:hypothetical protein [Caulobacter sp.]